MNPQQNYGPVADQRFPGLTSDQISRIEQLTANYKGMDKLKVQQQLYQQVINKIKNDQFTNDRFGAENDMWCRSYDKDSKQMNTDQCNVRLEALADIVKNKYNLNANTNTNEVINGVVNMAKDKNVNTDLLNKYLDNGDREFLYEMGFEENPEEKKTTKRAESNWLRDAAYAMSPVSAYIYEKGKWLYNHPEEDEEMAVGFAQSPGKRGYNLVGQWIDRAGKALADKLEGTELVDTIREKAIDIFGEEEVKNFAQKKQQELANGTAFNGRNATDIRTPLLGEERADSEYTQLGEQYGDIASAIALSYPMAAATAGSMGTATATQAGRSLLLGSLQGAADMAAYEYGSNQELANPAELGFGALVGGYLPIFPELYGTAKGAVNKQYDKIMSSFKESSKKNLTEELKGLFSKGVKPSAAGIKTTAAQEKIYDNALDAVETIVKNKNNLKFTNADGEVIEGQLPKNVYEFAQAIEQTKKRIYNEYSAIAKDAGQDVRVSVDELTDELLKLKNDKAALLGNPQLENAVDNWLKGLSEIEDLSVEQATKKVQEINKKLDAFYRNPNPNDVSSSSVDALVKNKLSEGVDTAIDSALGSSEQYNMLRKAYSKLKSIEKDVNHRAIVAGRQSPNSLVDSIADISSLDSLLDIVSGNPVGAIKALGKQALKKYIKSSNSSDNLVKKLFEKADKEIGKSGSLKINQKSLENGKIPEYNGDNINLNPNQLENGYNGTNGTNQGGIEGNVMDGGTNGGMVQEASMTNGGATQGGAGVGGKPIKVENGEDMVNISKDLQSKADRGLFMDVHSAEDYNGYKNFTNGNKSAAISVKPDGDIINFVSTEKGAGKDLMLQAIEEGGNKMDNYGVGLTRYYENFGFEPVAKVKFNREYAPEGWNFEKRGEPDIYVMKHNGDSLDTVKANYGKYKHKTPEELDRLPEMEYDDALAYRDDLIEFSNKTQKDLKTSEDVLKYSKANKDAILEQYREKKGNYVNPDDFRDFINDEDRLLASETQDGASWLAEQYFDKLIKENKNGKGLIIAGGPGGGKGTSIGKLGDEGVIDTKGAAIIVDKTKGTKELKKMLDNGMTVEWDVVVPNADGIVDNIIGRTVNQNVKKGFGKGRTLPINGYGIPTHKEVAQIAKDLYNESKNSNNLIVRFIDNTGKKEDINIKDGVEGIKLIEEFQGKLGNITEGKVKESVDTAYKEGKITKKQRDDMIKSITSILFVGGLLYGANEES